MALPTEDFTDVTLMEMMLEVLMGMVDMEIDKVADFMVEMEVDKVGEMVVKIPNVISNEGFTGVTLAIGDTCGNCIRGANGGDEQRGRQGGR